MAKLRFFRLVSRQNPPAQKIDKLSLHCTSAQVALNEGISISNKLVTAAPACGLVRIRCCSPTVSTTGPLVIINGMVGNDKQISNINPKRIKSIQILKTAAALALYGSRAAEGVIIIQTKGLFVPSPDYTLTPDEIPVNLFKLYEQHGFGGNKMVQYLLDGKKRKHERLERLDMAKVSRIKVYTDGVKAAQMGFPGGKIVVNVITK